jgi:hypothetical protein
MIRIELYGDFSGIVADILLHNARRKVTLWGTISGRHVALRRWSAKTATPNSIRLTVSRRPMDKPLKLSLEVGR